MEITSIKIKNIKGFGGKPIPINTELLSGKINLLIAPNGWGKSSIVAAFESLMGPRLEVKKEIKYKQDETLKSSLSIKLDGVELVADENKNEINNHIICKSIHCDTCVKTNTIKWQNFINTTGYTGIQDVEVMSVPKDYIIQYKFRDVQKSFGNNGKLLQNYSDLLQDESFIRLFDDDVFKALDSIKKGKTKKEIKAIVNILNNQTGTVESIKKIVQPAIFNNISSDKNYIFLKNVFCKGKSDIDTFLELWQILTIYNNEGKKVIKGKIKFFEYCLFKNKMAISINDINTTWQENIAPTEEDGKLIVKFPHADVISNGQRDIMTFCVRLQAFKNSLKPNKKYLLLIDEIFDYLDDANVLAAQYYLSNILKEAKKNMQVIIPCIFTHLDPKFFRNYFFNRKLLNVSYLMQVEAKASESMKTFIAYRQNLNRNEPTQNQLYDDLSKYCFHYNPQLPNISEKLKGKMLSPSKQVKAIWGKNKNLLNYLLEEINNYLNESKEFDPFAVSLAIRIATEKKVYDRLTPGNDRLIFFDNEHHTTNDKMNFAVERHIPVPDSYRILTIIHGEADHLEYNEANNSFIEKSTIYKLNHKVIRRIVTSLFDYVKGVPVSMDKLH